VKFGVFRINLACRKAIFKLSKIYAAVNASLFLESVYNIASFPAKSKSFSRLHGFFSNNISPYRYGIRCIIRNRNDFLSLDFVFLEKK